MNLELVGKDVTASVDLKRRIEQKLEKIETRLGRKLNFRVTLGKEANNGYSCTVHFTLNRHEFNAHAEADDLFKSTDDALAKIGRQVRKHLDSGHRRTHDSIRTTVESEELLV
jgi:ribosomal subunit interface protein